MKKSNYELRETDRWTKGFIVSQPEQNQLNLFKVNSILGFLDETSDHFRFYSWLRINTQLDCFVSVCINKLRMPRK